MTAQKGSINYGINPDQIRSFVAKGFDIYDDDGNKLDDPLKYADDKDIQIIPLFSGGNSQ